MWVASRLPKTPEQFRRAKIHGFTLTELAIVVGIIGVILGGVWTAAGLVNNSSKTQKGLADVTFITQGYRGLFAAHGIDISNWSDTITCMGIKSGFFPASTVQTGVTCVDGTISTYPVNPWGGHYAVFPYPSWQGIIVQIDTLTAAACASFGVQLLAQPDVIWETIDGVGNGPFSPWGAFTPWTETQIINQCTATGTGNSIQVMFKE